MIPIPPLVGMVEVLPGITSAELLDGAHHLWGFRFGICKLGLKFIWKLWVGFSFGKGI